jgi:hypothetical protein
MDHRSLTVGQKLSSEPKELGEKRIFLNTAWKGISG